MAGESGQCNITNFFPMQSGARKPCVTEDGEKEAGNKEVEVQAAKKARNLTCATVEKWKQNDLEAYDAESWLVYVTKSTRRGKFCTLLRCEVCKQFESKISSKPKFSRAFITGSTNLKLASLVDHAKTETHKLAMFLFYQAQGKMPNQSFPHVTDQPKLDFSLTPEQFDGLKTKFDLSYFVVKEELPLSKYEKLIALEKRHGVPHSSTYRNRISATEFVSFQAKEVLNQLQKDFNEAKFYSILFNGTTDTTVTEQEEVFVLYFDPEPAEPQLNNNQEPMVKVKMGFLSIEDLNSSDAKGVMDGIKQSLEKLTVPCGDDIRASPVGLGGDGCSTNRGKNNGVQAILKNEFPWFLFAWCVAHRLELALKDALNNTYFKEVDEVLLRLNYLYEKGPKKLRGLRELHLAYKESLEFAEGSLKPKRASGTRWIAHKLAALKILVDKFGILIQHLETFGQDRSVKSKDQQKLESYLKKWKNGKLFIYSCFFINLLQPAANLSKVFQGEDVDAISVSCALLKVKKLLNNVQSKSVDQLQTVKYYLNKVQDGVYQDVVLPRFEQSLAKLKNDYSSYVDLLVEALEDRIGGSSDITSVATVLNCEAWNSETT